MRSVLCIESGCERESRLGRHGLGGPVPLGPVLQGSGLRGRRVRTELVRDLMLGEGACTAMRELP